MENYLIIPDLNSYKMLLLTTLVCSFLNLTGDIKAQTFADPNFETVDTSMTKTVVSILDLSARKNRIVFLSLTRNPVTFFDLDYSPNL